MWIKQLEIEGFGTWSRQRFLLAPGLNVFLGPNEAGKSTLLNFVRAILFGFERRGQANRYEPLSGEMHGGRLLLDVDGAGFVVERLGGAAAPSSGRVVITDHEAKRFGEELLPHLLGGVSRELFCSVFAFGLGELEQLDSLSRADVEGIIFSAGIDTPVPIVRVEQALQREADGIFRKGKAATKPIINQGLAKLDELYQSLRDLAMQPAAYRDAVLERERLVQEVETDVAKLKELRAELVWTRTLAAAWDTWQEWQKVQAELAGLPVINSFPAQGEARLDELSRSLAEQSARLQTNRELLTQSQNLLAEISEGKLLDEHRNEVLDLVERRSVFLQNLDRYKQQVGVVAECKKMVDQRLAALGSGWTEDKVTSMPSGLEMKETVRSMRMRLQELADSVRDREAKLQEATTKAQEAADQVDSLRQKIQRLTADIEATSASTHGYEERRKAFQQYLSKQEQIRTLENKRQHLEQGMADLRRQVDALHLDGEFGPRPLRYLLSLMAAGGIAVVGAVLLGFFGYWFLSVLLGAVGGTFIAVGGWIRAFLSTQARNARQTVQTRRQAIEDELRERQKEYEEMVALLGKLQDESAASATICFGHAQPAEEEVVAVRDSLEREKELRTALLTLQAQLEEACGRLDKASSLSKQADERLREMQQSANEAWQQWESWLKEHGFAADLTPEGALEVIDGVSAALEAITKYRAEESTMNTLRKQIDAYCEQVNRLRELCRKAPVTSDNAAVAVLEFKSTLDQYDQLLAEAKQQQEIVTALEDEVLLMEGKLADLLREAGAKDAEDFRRLANIYDTRQGLERRLRELRVDLTSRSAERGFDAICRELAQTNAEIIAEKVKLLEMQEADLEDAVARKRTRIGEINQEIASLEQDQNRSAQQFAYDTLREEMNAAARQWAKLVIAKELIAVTRRRYEKTRQPEVLRQASLCFEEMTAGRYKRVFAPFGEQVIRVETADHRYLTVEQLSRGTVEQLYLAMRFALIGEFARRSVILPIIMDDILVNFDPVRLERTAAVIRELSQEHQVLFFSCHPHVAVALRGESQQGALIDLGSLVVA